MEEENSGARLNTLSALASVHRSHRSWSDAIATGEQALRLVEDEKGKEHPLTLKQLGMLSEVYDLSGNRRKRSCGKSWIDGDRLRRSSLSLSGFRGLKTKERL